MVFQPATRSSRSQIFFKIGVRKSFAKLKTRDRRLPVNFAMCNTTDNSKDSGQLKGIPHRFSLLVPEHVLCVTVSFQSNPFNSSYLFFEIAVFLNSYFSEQVFFVIAAQRSSHQRYSIKKSVLKYFAIFTGKHL